MIYAKRSLENVSRVGLFCAPFRYPHLTVSEGPLFKLDAESLMLHRKNIDGSTLMPVATGDSVQRNGKVPCKTRLKKGYRDNGTG